MSGQHTVEWIDRGREPQCAPNPRYPEGVDVDLSLVGAASCKVDLPYPAKRCGILRVECKVCGFSVDLTTAGRPDDPRSVKIACKVANQGPDQ